MQQLTRNDIVGQKIKQVWRTEWEIRDVKYHYCDTFVELENGTAFPLKMQDSFEEVPFYAADLSKLKLVPEEFGEIEYRGAAICEVLTSEYYPTPAILLSNRTILLVDLYLFYYTGPVIWNVESMDDIKEFVTYWGNNSLVESVFLNCG